MGSHFIAQAGLELLDSGGPPASASRVPGLQVNTTTPSQMSLFIIRPAQQPTAASWKGSPPCRAVLVISTPNSLPLLYSHRGWD